MEKNNIKILILAGVRPNFIKIAPLLEEIKKHRQIKPVLVHTGQHYDFKMSQAFFEDLNIPKPNYNLGVGSGSHAYQIGEALIRLEKVVLKEKPDLIIVVGDANSCLVGSLVATKLYLPVAHVEAGLRSFNRKMPEEINRLLTDHLSDYLFVHDPAAVENLLREGVEKKKIFFVGNIMIDSLEQSRKKIKNLKFYKKFGLEEKEYALLTLHRQENVDDRKIIQEIITAIERIQKRIKIIYPLHVRAEKRIKEFGFWARIKDMKNLIITSPLSYLKTLSLMADSRFVMTDSGGVQEETTILSIPCLTLREETERPVTVKVGTNKVVGTKEKDIVREALKILNGKIKKGKTPKYWDGKTAKRIISIILEKHGKQ